ncbi:MAG TPA: nitroreductase family deazaflavin-dependent oxidoreductase [Candidatus Bathyarchaeia archaeon]|nr:nitroreductase family deazaflavin-dependent oxidoreductase [Candidatus Bathyarchaeia archaeon]
MESRKLRQLDEIKPKGRGVEVGTEHRPFYFGLFNRIVRNMLRLGVPVGPTTLLSVRGRKTGRPRTTPVGYLEHNGHRYVFGTFGEGDWTRNLRATGEAIVGRGWRRKRVSAIELRVIEEKAMIMKEVLAPFLGSRLGSRMLQMGYDLKKDSTMEDYLREARIHPGFELLEKLADRPPSHVP